MKNLVIVESPTKSRTIEKFLGPGYKVLSSFGHIRDLPKSEFGVDVADNFKPRYVIPTKSRKVVSQLKKELKNSKEVILATDEDREGEAIAWHLSETLSLKRPKRIVFHEITKPAIEEALENPRQIDLKLVDSQQARRILDRIVGYKLSPFLWKKVAKGLSAGRVQSVAVRLVVERENEIKKFIAQEYWSITATLLKIKNKNEKVKISEFEAQFVKKDGQTLDKFAVKNKQDSEKIINDLSGTEYKVVDVQKKETRRNPLPPFTTSTLQQTAWQKFRYPAKFTMQIAQQLYEQGLITYHRTDSLNLSGLALATAKKFISANFGQNYYQFRRFKTKSKSAQEAHEAIRPTFAENTPGKMKEKLNSRQARLYDLVWRRFVASQMKPATVDLTIVDILAKNYGFRASGQMLKFDGFLKVYPIKYTENELPKLEPEEILCLIKLTPSQHFTQPPARYTEATLIKALEENGIGRPSTYAPTLSTVQERNYVQKDDQKRLFPTEIGFLVTDILIKHFPEVVDISFTAKMEEELDNIAEGKEKWQELCREFYEPFEQRLEKKYKEVQKKEFTQPETTDKTCPKCGSPLLIKFGRFGKFYACSAFPKCDYTAPLESKTLGIKCPKCGQGEIIEKRTRRGKIFYACNQYPNCNFALWDKPVNEKCPECGNLLVETKRMQIKCSNKNCKSNKKLAK